MPGSANIGLAGVGGLLLLTIGACHDTAGGDAHSMSGSGNEAIHFTSVTVEAGLGDFVHETGAEGKKLFPESTGSGCAFIDYDGDGWLDILLAGGGIWPGSEKKPVPPVWLYRNDGDGTFTNVTGETGLADVQTYSNGFAVADYDNDGDEDFFLTTLYENMLFRNDGGRFTEVGQEVGVASEVDWSMPAIFFDADRDGWLDLYVGNYVEWTPETDLLCTVDGKNKDYCTPQTYTGTPGQFFHNNGDGTFSDWTERAGLLPANGKTLGLAELDYNRDGWPDLMVSNDAIPNHLFVNRGDGTFEDRAVESGVAYDDTGQPRAGMGVDVGVVDSSGFDTIFIGHFSREMLGVFRYTGDDLFVDRAIDAGIGRTSMMTLTFGLFLFDIDLDGDLDLFATNGHVQPDVEKVFENLQYAQPVHLFLNDGEGNFTDAVPTLGNVLQERIVARGAAYGDYDGDGDLDVMVSENAGKVHLWRNEHDGSAYLRVHLRGNRSNRNAFGTRLIAFVEGRPIERRIRGGSSYLSSSEHTITFGLGSKSRVDSLLVQWPSGLVERFGEIDGGQIILIEEGSRSITPYRPGGSMAMKSPLPPH